MRVIKVLVGWSGPGAGTKLFHSQRIGAEKPRVLSVTVDRGFCPQSLYGIRTYDHKYTLRLANSDGALDQYRTLWSTDQATFSVYAADDSTIGSTWPTDTGTTDLKFARHISRVIVSSSEVILEADGGSIKEFLDVRLAQLYSALYNTFTENKPQLWAAGLVTVDLDAIQIVGASTDFDEGARAAEVVQVYANGSVVTPAAAVGAGEFSLTTASVEGDRIAAKLAQPTVAAPASSGDAFNAIMDAAGFVSGTSYTQGWSRDAMDETIQTGVSARDETRLVTIEKILAGFDAGLYESNTGKIEVTCLQDFYEINAVGAAYDLTQREILSIEVETAPFDGLGKRMSWAQNDAVHSATGATFSDPYLLQSANQSRDGGTYADYYKNNEGVKTRVFESWFAEESPGIADSEAHLIGFYSAENMLINLTAPGFDLQELNPGRNVSITHSRFDLGVMPNVFQLLSLRYDLMLLNTSMQLIGKKRF
jgi:hypothetical protein